MEFSTRSWKNAYPGNGWSRSVSRAMSALSTLKIGAIDVEEESVQ